MHFSTKNRNIIDISMIIISLTLDHDIGVFIKGSVFSYAAGNVSTM